MKTQIWHNQSWQMYSSELHEFYFATYMHDRWKTLHWTKGTRLGVLEQHTYLISTYDVRKITILVQASEMLPWDRESKLPYERMC